MQRRIFLAASTVLPSVLLHSRAWGQQASAWSYTPKKPEAPVSGYALVEERPGVKIYASNASTIQAVVITPTLEWVLTGTDLRCVARRKNEVRVFPLGKDALGDGIQGLVADEAEAFILVRLAGKTLLRCFHPVQGLHESIAVPDFSENSFLSPFLVLSATTVAYVFHSTPGSKGKLTPVTIDRRTRKIATLQALETEQRLVIFTATLTGNRLWLGTSTGLQSLPLRLNANWDHRFPKEPIFETALLSDGSLVIVRGDKRTILEKIDLQTSKVMPLPSPSDPTASLITAPDGTLWQLGLKYTFPGRTLNRLSPGGTWETIPWNAEKPAEILDEKTLPDSVAAMLVCQIGQFQIQSNLAFSPSSQAPWLQERFWRWSGPEQSGAFPVALRPRMSTGNEQDSVGLFEEDAQAPTAYFAANHSWLVGEQVSYYDEATDNYIEVPCPGRCTSIASLPSEPDVALLIMNEARASRLYRWQGGKLDPNPLPQPPGGRWLNALREVCESLYISTSDGVWRYQKEGKWKSLISFGYNLGRLIPDPQHPNVLWAHGGGYRTESASLPSHVVRLEI